MVVFRSGISKYLSFSQRIAYFYTFQKVGFPCQLWVNSAKTHILQLFSLLKVQKPEALQKLKVIPGDVTKNGLGISESDRQILIERVNIVFHSAATVKFDEDLKLALDINLQGTKRLIELCKSLKHLEVSFTISTVWDQSALHCVISWIFIYFWTGFSSCFNRL